jgi:hypothetical protein
MHFNRLALEVLARVVV